jgi:trehalose 6-phosphate synthase/phosphatase
MFFLDYDGTLSPLVDKPEDALPSAELKNLLNQLSSDAKNRIYIISGRDKKSLENWLGDLRLGMSAEHGCFLRPITISDESLPEVGEWKDLVKEEGIDVGWKDKVIEVFNSYAKRLNGSVVECKEYAITFHYRLCAKGASKDIVQELRKELNDLTHQFSTLNALKGKKSVEARLKGITKGAIIRHILDVNKRDGVNFVLCVGDDLTDEDMYTELENDKALKEGVFTCTVNFRGSKALSSVGNQKQVLGVLEELAAISLGAN